MIGTAWIWVPSQLSSDCLLIQGVFRFESLGGPKQQNPKSAQTRTRGVRCSSQAHSAARRLCCRAMDDEEPDLSDAEREALVAEFQAKLGDARKAIRAGAHTRPLLSST